MYLHINQPSVRKGINRGQRPANKEMKMKNAYKIWSRPAGFTVESIDGLSSLYISKPFACKDEARKHREEKNKEHNA